MISEIWRYPVSSLGGERIRSVRLNQKGLEGDRAFLLVDMVTGDVASPETTSRWRKALMLSARYNGADLVVDFPDRNAMRVCQDLNQAISDFMGFRCAIVRSGDRTISEPAAAPRYEMAPIHILTSYTLRSLSSALPESRIDVRRFRPNFVIEADVDEQTWIGRGWAAGTSGGAVIEATKRCGMTMIAQGGLPEDVEILRTIVRKHRRLLGVYASVTAEGCISVGDCFDLV